MKRLCLLLAIATASCKSSSTTGSGSVDGPENVNTIASTTAYQLWEEFGRNTLQADKKYSGQYVELNGSVRTVSKDGSRYVVGLAVIDSVGAVDRSQYAQMTPQERKWFNEGYPPNVLGTINSKHQDEFAKLKPYDEIKIIAKVVGTRKADVYKGYVLDLADCRLVSSRGIPKSDQPVPQSLTPKSKAKQS